MESNCPFCNALELCESERDYAHWRQFCCGSLILSDGEIERSRKCIIASLQSQLAAANIEVERLRSNRISELSQIRDHLAGIADRCELYVLDRVINEINSKLKDHPDAK